MAVRSPLYYNSGNLQEMSSAMVDEIVDQVVYQYSLNPGVTLSVVGSSHLSGAVIHKRHATTTNYTVTLTDYYIGADSTSNTILLSLPTASTTISGQTFIIKDEGGNANNNNITT